ncbi:tetraspanin-8 [Selaginella moellendorffii]|uniref:tetraspanin-8 n=1 Tax=Selaginella moellendorffii TaxID=88036 RepID=UPI000D1CB6E2|nr:tetraspanin-8 [Selaginella moellendorffii]|eukprot:XP_024525286.1 tetraspanin-8 [Selaginella moellendorffii]
MKLSNLVMGTLNFVTVVLSIPIIVIGIWLATNRDSDCMHFLQQPTISIGAIILVISLVGFLGSCYRVSWLLWIYLFLMLLLILLLVFFTVFTFLVSNRGASHAVAGTGFSEYRLGDYSAWLQSKVSSTSNWRKIKSCLQDSNVCRGMNRFHDSESFQNALLSPLESGCCKPPISCGYSYENATLWNVSQQYNYDSSSSEEDEEESSSNVFIGEDPDCSTWSNNQNELCFDCNSCRAGLLANIKRDWHKVAIVNLVVLVFLIVVYSVGCCAFYNAKREGYFNRRWIF